MMRAAAVIAAVAGAGGSLGLTIYVGRHNPSLVLMALFGLWVLSPFVALVAANLVSRPWPALTRSTLQCVTVVLTLGSLAIYGVVAFGPPRAKPASGFLMVPLASWLLIAVVLPIAAKVSTRR